MLNIISQYGFVLLKIKIIEYHILLWYLFLIICALRWRDVLWALIYLVFVAYPIYWVKIAETSSCFH